MKKYKIILFAFLVLPFLVTAQKKAKDTIPEKPERPAFESSFIIDNPTNVLFIKNTLEITMNHRFGEINDDKADLAGFWGASNIRIAASYAILDQLTIGYGTTKENLLQDFSVKGAILRQTRSNTIPVSITYYGNMVIDARKRDNSITSTLPLKQHRYSFFHQIIIAKRFSPNFSLQIAPSLSHYNYVETYMQNDRFSIALGGRLKISPQTALLFDYSQPLTQFDDDPDRSGISYNHPGLSLGAEFSTSGHAFQLFITNLHGIVPQRNYVKNTNDFFDGEFMIGFNITRRYNF
ncbi:MAG TPA: DUF5777 family beta-barrel protein [Flavobacteriaceae bacterium]|nr:DUF5777 family beta-barrel protein [Flavobacteriaceae bacterium]